MNTAYVAWGSSPWTYKNETSRPENIKILGGKIDSISKGGQEVNLSPGESFGLANKQWIHLKPGESVTITYTTSGILRRYRA
jgi:uncharacterized cupin superfamily protein